MPWLLGIALTAYAAILAAQLLPATAIHRIDQYFYDLRMRAQPAKADPRIVIVDIDEKSVTEIGRWPWSRNVVADLVTSLTDHYQVKALGFDIIFAEPDGSSGYATMEKLAHTELKSVPQLQQRLQALKPVLDYDGRLAAAIKGRPVVMGYLFSSEPQSVSKGVLPPPAFSEADLEGRPLYAFGWRSYIGNLPQLQNAAGSGGFFNPVLDADGVVRSVPLIAKFGDRYYESLALATARMALGAETARPVPFRSKERREYGALESLALDDPQITRNIPIERNLTVLVNYRSAGGVNHSHFRYLSAVDVIHHRLPAAELADKIVLVGTTIPGLYDLRATPVSPNYPGVEIHANIIESILDSAFLQRPDFSLAYDFLQVVLVGLLLAILLPMLGPFPAFLLAGGSALAIAGLNFWLYQSDYLVLPMATALLLILMLFVVNLAWSYLFEFRNRHAMVHLFGEYVAPELVAEMAANPKNYSMESESRELTVLFSDVRGFTTISETLPPGELREYINAYLTAMSEDIRGNRGTLDKYIGDAVMAFWGAPVPLANHAALAVASALTMQQTVVRLNADFAKRNWPPLHIGVGLNTGEMRVGDMGSQVRRAYTVMGDAVNLGSRLESITKVYGVGIIVGVGTRNAAPDYAYRELDRVRVKGKNEPVPIFEPLGLNSELDATARSVLDQWHEALAHFRAQRWDDAEPLLLTLQSTQPHPLYALYLQRIDTYRHHPLPADWDGVTTFDT
ncbi:MAG TPA: adenylate/guanylate cyclase domain-containing protein, partial [Oxalicibacterium sp.]|nr:adenylate/guanylate cyclase domain-containing protein [Oxalicibacterium sp.]